jgi:hypothetical protein
MEGPNGEIIPDKVIMMELDIPPGIIAMQPQEVYDHILNTNTEEENYEFCAQLIKLRKEYLESSKI